MKTFLDIISTAISLFSVVLIIFFAILFFKGYRTTIVQCVGKMNQLSCQKEYIVIVKPNK